MRADVFDLEPRNLQQIPLPDLLFSSSRDPIVFFALPNGCGFNALHIDEGINLIFARDGRNVSDTIYSGSQSEA